MTEDARRLLETSGYFLKELGQTGTYLLGRRGKDEAALAEFQEFLEKPRSGREARELITGFFGVRVYGDNRLTENGWGELHHMLLAGKQKGLLLPGDAACFGEQALIQPGQRLAEIHLDSIDSAYQGAPFLLYNSFWAGGHALNIPSARLNNGTSFISVVEAAPGPELPTDLQLEIATLRHNQGRPA